MKVLEYCATLSGILPDCEITTSEATKNLEKRNEEVMERMVRSEMT